MAPLNTVQRNIYLVLRPRQHGKKDAVTTTMSLAGGGICEMRKQDEDDEVKETKPKSMITHAEAAQAWSKHS